LLAAVYRARMPVGALAKLFERHGGKDVVSRFAGSQDSRGGAAARS
jgi:hypothetical protein